jgi:hypothetical protein
MAAPATNQRPVGGNPAPRRCLAMFAITIPLALSGCGTNTTTVETHTVTATAEPTTTTTTPPLRDAVSAWQQETLAPMQELGDAMDKISNASKAGDLTTMGITCQHAHDATEQLQQHMPSPDPDLTAALQKAISDYNSATQICTTAVENNNLTDFAQGSDLLGEANNYMDTAVSILRRDLGQSSDSSGGAAKRSSTVPAQASPPSALQEQDPLPDADTHGFLNYAGAARCHGVDPAVLIVRTQQSAAVMCQSIPGEYYYRGLRLSDGATMELAGATAAGTGFTVTNPADGTKYELSRSGLEIQGPGQSVSESAIESAD